ncbi:MAG: YbhB/YbcL family Raf kinase inhibitor-like protein [Planctomycetes bacterium]|nr:YbhB/YbcL family Raf kinase inhibitor-like protein [Planctomycetota bacterium]
MAIQITSTAFEPGGPIPRKYTGEGPDVSPALSWTGVPAGSKELALICDDPDAPTPKPWVHWVLYQLSTSLTGLREGDAGGGLQGKNDFGQNRYGGPMPPPGHGVHHYHFKMYALDTSLEAGSGWTKDRLLAAMKGHILAEGELIGTYERK